MAAAGRMGGAHHGLRGAFRRWKSSWAPCCLRESGQWRLTEAGRQLLAVSNATKKRCGWAGARPLAQAAPTKARLVRVGATEGFGTQMLASELAKLTLRYPLLSVDLLAPCCTCPAAKPISSFAGAAQARPGHRHQTHGLPALPLWSARIPGAQAAGGTHRRPAPAQLCALCGRPAVHAGAAVCWTPPAIDPSALRCAAPASPRSTAAVRAGAGLAVLPAFVADKDPIWSRKVARQACFTRTF